MSNAAAFALEPRDGPTGAFKKQHATVSRANGGKRVLSRLEMLLDNDAISPEAADAGRRFRDDHLIGIIGRSRSCIDVGVGGSSNGAPSEERLDATGRFNAARDKLDGRRWIYGQPPSIMVLMCVVYDEAWAQIGRAAGITSELARAEVVRYLKDLASFYAAVDAKKGIDATPHTKELALRRLIPAELDDPAEEKKE